MSKSNIIFGTIIGLILLMSILGMTSADSCDDKSFIRKHQAIGVCPYELATNLKLNNPNKWLGLIEMAKE